MSDQLGIRARLSIEAVDKLKRFKRIAFRMREDGPELPLVRRACSGLILIKFVHTT